VLCAPIRNITLIFSVCSFSGRQAALVLVNTLGMGGAEFAEIAVSIVGPLLGSEVALPKCTRTVRPCLGAPFVCEKRGTRKSPTTKPQWLAVAPCMGGRQNEPHKLCANGLDIG
jgi:hypothetical protein